MDSHNHNGHSRSHSSSPADGESKSTTRQQRSDTTAATIRKLGAQEPDQSSGAAPSARHRSSTFSVIAAPKKKLASSPPASAENEKQQVLADIARLISLSSDEKKVDIGDRFNILENEHIKALKKIFLKKNRTIIKAINQLIDASNQRAEKSEYKKEKTSLLAWARDELRFGTTTTQPITALFTELDAEKVALDEEIKAFSDKLSTWTDKDTAASFYKKEIKAIRDICVLLEEKFIENIKNSSDPEATRKILNNLFKYIVSFQPSKETGYELTSAPLHAGVTLNTSDFKKCLEALKSQLDDIQLLKKVDAMAKELDMPAELVAEFNQLTGNAHILAKKYYDVLPKKDSAIPDSPLERAIVTAIASINRYADAVKKEIQQRIAQKQAAITAAAEEKARADQLIKEEQEKLRRQQEKLAEEHRQLTSLKNTAAIETAKNAAKEAKIKNEKTAQLVHELLKKIAVFIPDIQPYVLINDYNSLNNSIINTLAKLKEIINTSKKNPVFENKFQKEIYEQLTPIIAKTHFDHETDFVTLYTKLLNALKTPLKQLSDPKRIFDIVFNIETITTAGDEKKQPSDTFERLYQEWSTVFNTAKSSTLELNALETKLKKYLLSSPTHDQEDKEIKELKSAIDKTKQELKHFDSKTLANYTITPETLEILISTYAHMIDHLNQGREEPDMIIATQIELINEAAPNIRFLFTKNNSEKLKQHEILLSAAKNIQANLSFLREKVKQQEQQYSPLTSVTPIATIEQAEEKLLMDKLLSEYPDDNSDDEVDPEKQASINAIIQAEKAAAELNAAQKIYDILKRCELFIPTLEDKLDLGLDEIKSAAIEIVRKITLKAVNMALNYMNEDAKNNYFDAKKDDPINPFANRIYIALTPVFKLLDQNSLVDLLPHFAQLEDLLNNKLNPQGEDPSEILDIIFSPAVKQTMQALAPPQADKKADLSKWNTCYEEWQKINKLKKIDNYLETLATELKKLNIRLNDPSTRTGLTPLMCLEAERIKHMLAELYQQSKEIDQQNIETNYNLNLTRLIDFYVRTFEKTNRLTAEYQTIEKIITQLEADKKQTLLERDQQTHSHEIDAFETNQKPKIIQRKIDDKRRNLADINENIKVTIAACNKELQRVLDKLTEPARFNQQQRENHNRLLTIVKDIYNGMEEAKSRIDLATTKLETIIHDAQTSKTKTENKEEPKTPVQKEIAKEQAKLRATDVRIQRRIAKNKQYEPLAMLVYNVIRENASILNVTPFTLFEDPVNYYEKLMKIVAPLKNKNSFEFQEILRINSRGDNEIYYKDMLNQIIAFLNANTIKWVQNNRITDPNTLKPRDQICVVLILGLRELLEEKGIEAMINKANVKLSQAINLITKPEWNMEPIKTYLTDAMQQRQRDKEALDALRIAHKEQLAKNKENQQTEAKQEAKVSLKPGSAQSST